MTDARSRRARPTVFPAVGRVRRVPVSVAAALACAIAGAPAGAAAAPRCDVVRVAAGAVLCASSSGTFAVSRDGGRTWPTRGTVEKGATAVLEVAVSPGFDKDRTAWVQTTHGWYVSRDGGATFAGLDVVAEARPDVAAAYVDAAGSPVLVAMGRLAATPPNGAEYRLAGGQWVKTPIAGPANAYPVDLVLPPAYPSAAARVVTQSFVSGENDATGVLADGASVRECRAAFVCAPPSFRAGDGQIGISTGEIAPGQQYLFTADYDTAAVRVHRGRDWGAAWSRWPSLEKLLAPLARSSGDAGLVLPALTVTAAPDRPARLFAMVTNTRARLDGVMTSIAAKERVPAFRLLRSDDDGKTWREIGASYARAQRPRATARTLPWNGGTGELRLYAAPGRLYLVAAYDGHSTRAPYGRNALYVSSDSGVTWRRATA